MPDKNLWAEELVREQPDHTKTIEHLEQEIDFLNARIQHLERENAILAEDRETFLKLYKQFGREI